MSAATGFSVFLADPTGQIERECADKRMKQADVASTYGLAIRDEGTVPVDWARVNAAIRNRWPRGLVRVKTLAWKKLEEWRRDAPGVVRS